MNNTNRDKIVSPRNPKSLGEQEGYLYESEGNVYSIGKFVDNNLHLLDEYERNIIKENSICLSENLNIPPLINRCLTRTEDLRVTKKSILKVKRSGARSAYWQEKNIKFKGCRPLLEPADYPIEKLPFGEKKIQYSRIPFGILTKEAVMREILGYCFFKKYGLDSHITPVCIYEYQFENQNHGYCLVLKTKSEIRVEEFIEYPDFTLGDMVTIDTIRKTIAGYDPMGYELNLRGLNLWWYVEEKTKILNKMHFNGGFRGILNSNIGNDVIFKDKNGEIKLYLSDFDTFRVIKIPTVPTESFIKAFALHCLIEVVKGSISIFEFVDLSPELSASERGERLSDIYFQKNSLWRAYKRRFDINVKQRGWDVKLFDYAIEDSKKTEAFADVVSTCVMNSHYLRENIKHRSIYYPHN